MKSVNQGLHTTAGNVTLEKILRYIEPVHPEAEVEEVFTEFSANQNLRSIPVVKDGCPLGLIHRYELVDKFSQSIHRELQDKKHCADVMDAHPLLVEKSTSMDALCRILSISSPSHFTDGFIVTEHGQYVGLATGQDFLREMASMVAVISNNADPLTYLSSSTSINEHIESLLQSGLSFAVCNADLNHFKSFNDAYGYRKGDGLIRFVGELLNAVCDPQCDFVGHIVGDEFIFILQSQDWEQRCNQALTAFAQTSGTLFDKEHRAIGGYIIEDRQSRLIHYPLPTLSIGVVWVAPKSFGSHYEVTEAVSVAKEMAKKKPGNSLFIERRKTLAANLSSHQGAEAHYG
jgi:diguanylate cyclase (GGDEF)-like protein